MEILEKFYTDYLMSYDQHSNCEGYDADAQLTRDRIEQILKKGYMDNEDIDFVRSIIPDIEDYWIRKDLEEYINSIL